MANWQNFEFFIPRQTDRQVLSAAEGAFKKADVPIGSMHFTLAMGPAYSGTPATVMAEADLQRVLSAETQMIGNFAFQFGGDKLWVRINRESDLRDKVLVQLTALTSEPHLLAVEQALALAVALKDCLKEMNARAALDMFGTQVRSHFEMREANLAKLESTMERLVVEFGSNVATQRRELDEEFTQRRHALDAETTQLRSELLAEYEGKQARLQSVEEALQERLKAVDDAHARHARRKIREDLKKELASRATTFNLTAGTQGMRKPISSFLTILLCLFALGLVAYSWEMFRLLQSGPVVSNGMLVALAVRQAAFAAAFGSTAIFFIRWSNRWLDQHASEEFKLKRLELDFDRASWVVEMAMEWKEENQGDIPTQLLERLTAHLFDTPENDEPENSSLDRLASTLLGASAEATLQLPGGGSIKLDRKSVRDLAKPGG